MKDNTITLKKEKKTRSIGWARKRNCRTHGE